MYLTDIVFSWEERDENKCTEQLDVTVSVREEMAQWLGVWETHSYRWSRVRRPSMGLAFEKKPKKHVRIYVLDKWLWQCGGRRPHYHHLRKQKSLKQVASKDLSFLGHTLIWACHLPPAFSDWHLWVVKVSSYSLSYCWWWVCAQSTLSLKWKGPCMTKIGFFFPSSFDSNRMGREMCPCAFLEMAPRV